MGHLPVLVPRQLWDPPRMVMHFPETSDDEVVIRAEAITRLTEEEIKPVAPTQKHMPELDSDSSRQCLEEPPTTSESIGPAPTSLQVIMTDSTTTPTTVTNTNELADTEPIREELASITLHADPEADSFE